MKIMKKNMNTSFVKSFKSKIKLLVVFSLILFIYSIVSASVAEAASLSLSPSTGVYTANGTFSVRVLVNTGGSAVNAAEGTLSFNPNQLSVVSVNRSGSIFNLWVTEPTYSNSAGTISFSGGLPSGYSGNTGTIMTVTFRAAGAGTAKVNFSNGSVLANDGKGTNILTSMNGGTYTIQALTTEPEPEVVVEYVAPANTPAAPVISSETHPDPSGWYANDEAVLNWNLSSDVIAVRTLLNEAPTTIPTKVYEDPIKTITLPDLDEGISYFHLQFKNSDGWGKVTHYRLAVDTEKPTSIDINLPSDANLTSPLQKLEVKVEDETSLVNKYKVKLDANEPFEYVDETGSSTITLPAVDPGYHTVIIEAFDQAGNSIVGTYSFTVSSFDRPEFTEYPTQINEEVIPVIKGVTRPNSTVEVRISKIGAEETIYSVTSDAMGEFVVIPSGTFSIGVYELVAQATDEFGAQSDPSNSIRIAVQQPGYLKIGSMIVSVLSVIIPLIVLLVLMIFGIWYLIIFARRFRRKVRIESYEALSILRQEFADLQSSLHKQETKLQESRRTKKLTKAETGMIEEMSMALQMSEKRVEKEIEDITELAKKKIK